MADYMNVVTPIETLTVAGTSVPLAAIPSGANTAQLVVEDNAIRYLIDGNAPTASVGALAQAGSIIQLVTREQINNFRAISVDGSDVKVTATYYSN